MNYEIKKASPKFSESIGLDIGSHSVKIVHLKRLSDGFKLLNLACQPTVPEGVEYTLSDLRRDRYIPVIAQMLKSLKINPRKVQRLVSAVGGEQVSIKQIKTIFLPDDELETALPFEAKKHLAIAGGEMVLDYQVLSVEERTNNMNILLVATTREHLRGHTDILQSVGLTPHYVDVEALAVANSFALNSPPPPTPPFANSWGAENVPFASSGGAENVPFASSGGAEGGVYVILNIGAHRTNMVVYGTASKFFSRDIDFGGFHFTKDIQKRHNLSWEEAEDFKLEYGLQSPETPPYPPHRGGAGGGYPLTEGGGHQTPDTISINTIDITDKTTQENIALEVKRSLRYYAKEASNSDFHKVLLTGGSAKLAGLADYLAESLNLPCKVYDPFFNLQLPDKFRHIADPQFALAVGLASRRD